MTETAKPNKRIFRRLCKIDHRIQPGDLLLFRRDGIIARGGRGVHSHAAMADRLKGELYCLEVRERKGGRIVTLESQVKRYPGRIDVYKAGGGYLWEDYESDDAAAAMRTLAGCDYGWWSVLKAAVRHLPFIRWRIKPVLNGDTPDLEHAPFCSEAVSWATKRGGVDPVPNLPNHLTEPADLARSNFFAGPNGEGYLCSLNP